MKLVSTVLFLFLFNGLVWAQDKTTIPRLEKIEIEKTGCYAYFPKSTEKIEFDLKYSPDSSKVYTGEVLQDKHHFAVLLVNLNFELKTNEEKENIIIAYLDYLKSQFEIKSSAGYGKGHKLESNPNAIGVIDYWEDVDKNKWAIKAWADKNTLAVMMIYGLGDYPYFSIQEMFLNGFRFNK